MRSIPTLAGRLDRRAPVQPELRVPHRLPRPSGGSCAFRAGGRAGGARGGRGDHAAGAAALGRRVLRPAGLALVPAPPGAGPRQRRRMRGEATAPALWAFPYAAYAFSVGFSLGPSAAGSFAGRPSSQVLARHPLPIAATAFASAPSVVAGSGALDSRGSPAATLAARLLFRSCSAFLARLPEREGLQSPIRVGRPARLRDAARRRRGALRPAPARSRPRGGRSWSSPWPASSSCRPSRATGRKTPGLPTRVLRSEVDRGRSRLRRRDLGPDLPLLLAAACARIAPYAASSSRSARGPKGRVPRRRWPRCAGRAANLRVLFYRDDFHDPGGAWEVFLRNAFPRSSGRGSSRACGSGVSAGEERRDRPADRA